MVHSVNSTPGIKQGHVDKTEFENSFILWINIPLKVIFFFLNNKTVVTYPNIFCSTISNAHLLPNYIFCCASLCLGNRPVSKWEINGQLWISSLWVRIYGIVTPWVYGGWWFSQLSHVRLIATAWTIVWNCALKSGFYFGYLMGIFSKNTTQKILKFKISTITSSDK